MPQQPQCTCRICGARLSAEESEFYSDTCDACTRAWSAHVDDYRQGAEDLDLDRLFGAGQPVVLH